MARSTTTERKGMPACCSAAVRLLAVLFGFACFLIQHAAPLRANDLKVDLELVLAVDISYSMDEEELRLQRAGYVAAFRSDEVRQAILTGRHRRIAVIFVEWAGQGRQFIRVPWHLIDSVVSAETFAQLLEAQPIGNASRTSISGALKFSAQLFEGNGYAGIRRVVDISGDGANNSGSPVVAARDAVVAQGIVINGLPLILRPSYLSGFSDALEISDYYRDCVIGGFGSFLITIEKLSEMQHAIRQKLVQEIAHREPTPRFFLAAQLPGRPKADCLIGEKLRYDDP